MTDASRRKVALITGSGTGVGAAAALQLARQGFNVLINYSRSADDARQSQAACIAAGASGLVAEVSWRLASYPRARTFVPSLIPVRSPASLHWKE